MEIKLIGGNAEGQILEVPDGTLAWDVVGGDGSTTRYVSHYRFELGDARAGRPLAQEAFFAPASMTPEQALARAHELFDDPEDG